MSTAPVADDAKTKARETARETAKNTPLKNATTLRGIYDDYKDKSKINKDKIDNYRFPAWVLDEDRWNSDKENSHKFDETIVVYDNDDDIEKVKELVEQREPVNITMERHYKQDELEKNFGWKKGAYEKSNTSELYPNIGIYCHARVKDKADTEEKDVHVMNLIGYGFDSEDQPDYKYFLDKYKMTKADITYVMSTNDETMKKQFKEDLIQRYRKIWLKACYICKFKELQNLWYYGVGNNNFSTFLPLDWALSINFYNQIFAPAFGIDPTNSNSPHSTNNNKNDLDIPINFCKEYGINVQNLGTSSSKHIPDVLFTPDTTPADTLYINAWDPWSIIGNGNAGDESLDGHWGRNSNMSVLGWSMTNSKLLPDIVGDGDISRKSKILSMKEILAEIEAAGAGKAPVSGDTALPPSTPRCKINAAAKTITGITTECQTDIFSLVAEPVISSSSDEPTKMSNLVSAIGTDYSNTYAAENIMPAGSATLLYIGDTYLYNIKHSGSTWDPGSETTTKIKYMIHASPAKAGQVERDITKDTISNSVMNSLILAAKNGVKKIIFPFIGGQIFYDKLKNKVDAETGSSGKKYDKAQHAEVLVKGVTDFYNNLSLFGIKLNPIEEIYFLTYNDGISDEETGMHQAIKNAIGTNHALKDVLKQLTIGNLISNVIPPHGVKNIDAIVNAGNTNHGFSNGSGIADMCFAGLGDKMDYQRKLDTIKTNFIEAFNAYIANPSAASSPPPSKPPATPPTPITTKVPFANVLTTLESQLSDQHDDDVNFTTMKITESVLLYPPDVDTDKKKNLNSAEPDIKKMIEDFETAADGDDTKFYLGACRSIQAAYVLEKGDKKEDSAEAMRAKLLLNLRKNSLLLKVPARWDYKEMKLGVEPGPPTDEKELMNYSLQDTIEYYSEGGSSSTDEKARFAELKIDKEPEMVWEFILKLTKYTIVGVDRRFVKGINADMGNACFFVATLQLLFCDEDFLQLIIFLSCQMDDYISNIQGISGNECVNKSISNLETRKSETYDPSQPTPAQVSNVERGKKFLNDLVKLFKAYIIGKKIENDLMKSLYDTLALRYGKQQDSSEIITRAIGYLECLDNPYVKKYLSNNFLELKETITYPTHADFQNKANTTTKGVISDKLIMTKIPAPVPLSPSVQTLVDSYLNEKQDFEFTNDDINNSNIRQKIIEECLTNIPDVIDKNFCEMCQQFLTFSNDTSNKTQLASIFEGYDTKSADYTTENSEKAPREQSELKITLDDIKKAITTNATDEDICRMIVGDIKYVILNPMAKESGSSTYTNLKKISKKIVNKYSGYIFININRTLKGGKKNTIDINISKKLNIDSSTYTLVGYVFHSGPTSIGGHFVCVKCDSDGEPKVEISDSSVTKWTDKYAKSTEWGTGVFLLIYKQKKVIQGGGSNNIHATTTHTASKSKHNTSFKVSSSSKVKAKSRSHTQRVK